MAYLDLADTITLRSTEDVFISVKTFKDYGHIKGLSGFKDVRVIAEGDLVEVAKLDWEMYKLIKNSKSVFMYPARKYGNKKSHKFYSLWFLEESV